MVIMVLMLAGCGSSFPDMTLDEEQAIGEYAAKLLLKYDANNRSRLVSREEVAALESQLEQTVQNWIPEQTHEGMGPVDDTPIIEIGQETSGNVSTGSLEGFYELADGIKVTYQGTEICESYSQDGDANAYFALDASEGKKLLVLKFRIENQSQAEQNIDLLSKSGIIKVTVNGNSYSALTTMLMEDMSTYMGDVPADGSIDTVLLAEIDGGVADNISSLTLNLKNDSKKCTIQLQ